jgi:hypothetical protein
MSGFASIYFNSQFIRHNVQSSPLKVKEDEVGRSCSTNGGDEECVQDIGGKARMKETTRKNKTYVGEQY